MANELKFITPNVQYAKNGVKVDWAPGTLQVSQTNAKAVHNVQNIGTSAEAIVFGDIAAANYGYAILRNLDQTNFVVVSLANDATSPFTRLNAGEHVVLRLTKSATYYAKADTGAVNLEVIAFED